LSLISFFGGKIACVLFGLLQHYPLNSGHFTVHLRCSLSAASSGNQIERRSPAAADPLQHLDSANAAGLMLVLASDIDEQLTVNARRSP
jgi:hypothetical protein